MLLRLLARLALVLLIAASALPRLIAAQSPTATGVIRGVILDSASATPVLAALVIVRLAADTSQVTRAQVAANGTFAARGLRIGRYVVRVSALGYTPVVRNFEITTTQSTVDAGAIHMTRYALALKGVDVKENVAAVEIGADRNTYKAKDIAPGAANASEVLEQTPSVQVDADGKVSLRGNESVVVQVNGRPTPMTGVQLGSYLKSLPANVVDRVEVIPNPSAKYDPEGTAGIINVLLKTTVDLGLSGGGLVNVHSAERYTLAGNVGYQRGKFTTASSLSATNDIRKTPGLNDLLVYDAVRTPLAFSNQDIDERTGNGGQTFTNTVDYKPNKRDLFSNALTLNHRMGLDETNSSYAEGAADNTNVLHFDRLLRSNVTGVLFDEDVAFKRAFVPRKHEIGGELRFTRTRESQTDSLWREPLSQSGTATSRIDREQNDILAVARQFSAQLDYLRTFGDRTKLESGYKGTGRWYDRDFDVEQDSLGTGTWTPSARSNAFTFSEIVNAAYGVLSAGAGKFDATAGLRAEVASREFSLAATGASTPFHYGSVFPSAALRYAPDNATQLRASYSRRIRRPAANELNPFPVFYDLQNVFVGNANLNPEYTDAIELGLVRSGKRGTLQLSPFFRYTTNVIRTVITPGQRVAGRDVTTFQYANIARSRSVGADFNASLPSTGRIAGFTSFNVYKTEVDGTPQASLSPTGVTWTWRANATARISPTVLFNVAYIYRAEIPVANGHFYRAQNTNITLRKKINGDRSSLAISVVDPLATNTFHILVRGAAVDQETQRTLGLRGVFVRYQFNFGQTPKVREVQPDGDTGGAGIKG